MHPSTLLWLPVSQACQPAPWTWSSTAWTVTRSRCWGSTPGTSQPLTGPTATVRQYWPSTPTWESRRCRPSGLCPWASRCPCWRARAGPTSATSGYPERSSRKWGSATTLRSGVNSSSPCTRQERRRDAAPGLRLGRGKEESRCAGGGGARVACDTFCFFWEGEGFLFFALLCFEGSATCDRVYKMLTTASLTRTLWPGDQW